jgi:hypothetical protein
VGFSWSYCGNPSLCKALVGIKGMAKVKPGDLVTLAPRVNYSRRKGILGFVVSERSKRTKYMGLPDHKNETYKEYKVLVMTSGKYRWFAESSLELMDEKG